MNIEFIAQIWKEGDQYIAHAMPLDIASSGKTPEMARAALDEAIHLFLTTAQQHGTLKDVLAECGYTHKNDKNWFGLDWVAMEKHTAKLAA